MQASTARYLYCGCRNTTCEVKLWRQGRGLCGEVEDGVGGMPQEVVGGEKAEGLQQVAALGVYVLGKQLLQQGWRPGPCLQPQSSP